MNASPVSISGRRILLVLLACVLAFTVACPAAAFAMARPARPFAYLPAGYEIQMCFRWPSKAQPRLGLWWLSTAASAAPRWGYVSLAYPDCRFLPWLPILPQFGVSEWP